MTLEQLRVGAQVIINIRIHAVLELYDEYLFLLVRLANTLVSPARLKRKQEKQDSCQTAPYPLVHSSLLIIKSPYLAVSLILEKVPY